MKLIDSDAKSKINFQVVMENLLKCLDELKKYSDPNDYNIDDFFENSKLDSHISTLLSVSFNYNLVPELGFVIYKNLNNSILSYLIKQYQDVLSYSLDNFEKYVEEYYKNFLCTVPRYKVTPLEYYQILTEDKIVEQIHYDKEAMLFLRSGQFIIFPLEELLQIHLKSKNQEMGQIEIHNNNSYAVYFSRKYLRWMGVGKDDLECVEYYRFNITTLQLERLHSTPS